MKRFSILTVTAAAVLVLAGCSGVGPDIGSKPESVLGPGERGVSPVLVEETSVQGEITRWRHRIVKTERATPEELADIALRASARVAAAKMASSDLYYVTVSSEVVSTDMQDFYTNALDGLRFLTKAGQVVDSGPNLIDQTGGGGTPVLYCGDQKLVKHGKAPASPITNCYRVLVPKGDPPPVGIVWSVGRGYKDHPAVILTHSE